MSKLWMPPAPFLSGTDDGEMLNGVIEQTNLVEKEMQIVSWPRPHSRADVPSPKPHMPAKSPLVKEKPRGIYKTTRECPEGLIGFLIFPVAE